MQQISFCRWFALAFMLTVAGCGDDGSCPVSGTVTLDGQPVAMGSISFRPAKGTTGNTAGAAIVEGRYAVAAERGLPPGEYTVQVETYYKTGQKFNDPQKGIVDVEKRVDYNEQGRLTATVAAGKNDDINFAVTTAGRR